MKQYIVTEEQLNKIHYRKKKNPDNGSKYLHLPYWELDDLIKEIRSRPVQSADDVLDSLLDDLEFLDTYGEEQGIPLVSLLDVQNRIDAMKAELRKGGRE